MFADTINLHFVSYSLKAILDQSSTSNSVIAVIMSNVFDIVHSSCNRRNKTKFRSKIIYTTKYGMETLSYIGPKNGAFNQMTVKGEPC